MADRCPYDTAAGSQCRRNVTYRLNPEMARPGCKTHLQAQARELAPMAGSITLRLVDVATFHMVDVTPKRVVRRKAFALPITATSARIALTKVQSLHEWSLIFRAALTNRWCAFKPSDALYCALVNAKQRLLDTASPIDLAAYNGTSLKGVS